MHPFSGELVTIETDVVIMWLCIVFEPVETTHGLRICATEILCLPAVWGFLSPS
ncbi:hypothetical protein EXN66_Car010938 [Channa argus]|uniref:Uncharacterized protein n=1 Tax=Channa argus TaxID=215402 RepID=A0A6G1PYB6_CHAAH|nr:hypothetical protein EXN66_Car010938 [Channa argus]